MNELERINKYIERTKNPKSNYEMNVVEWMALAASPIHVVDKVSLAYKFGKAKGYRLGINKPRRRTQCRK